MNKIKYIVLAAALLFCAVDLSAQSALAELNFYKKQGQSEDKKLLESLDRQLGAWLDKNYSLSGADDALVLKAGTEVRIKKYPAAFVTLLRHKYEFPNSGNAPQAAALFNTVIENMPKAERENLKKAYALKSVPKDSDDRMAEFLSSATRLGIKGSYEPLNTEYRSFFARFPVYGNKDKMELMLGDLERFNKNYQAAIMQYQKVYDIYPSTKYKAASLRMLGDIYAGELKDYNQAAYYYNGVIKNFPNSIEIATTYNHMAIMNDNQRDYSSAVENITKAAEAYLKTGQRAKAYEASLYKADLQNKKMKDYAGATDTLNKTAKIFAKDESKFINCKLLAAEIYSRKLKDDYSELKAYEEIIAKYPSSAQAAKALYEAGMINERLANYQKAKELYQKLIISRPADAYATKAQRRVNKIEKQLAATQTAPQTGEIKKPAEAETEEEDIEILEELK
ncbi:tetratricopeptide repeat protein [Candidatus Proelusimicrobium excrementi]|uniref:tetratricopeptide repeat protein n=1 Tax=Candidatus Proelusimicrobium excrementi TaxID=3416222 RepID=UPI003D0B6E10